MEYLLELMRLRLKGSQIQLQKGVAGEMLEGHVLGCWGHVAREFGKKSTMQLPSEASKAKVQKGSEGDFVWPITRGSGFTVGRGGSPRSKKAGSTRRERESKGGKAYVGKQS